MLYDKVYKYITQNSLIHAKDTVIVALSGGADSVCLFDILLKISDKLDITVECAHLNHNLRGEESDGDQLFVKHLCDKHCIKLHTKSVDVKKLAAGLSIEDAARQARYCFFEEISKNSQSIICTAHNKNDNTETFFINLLRGSGSRGLCAIPNKRDNIVRPLLCATRAEILNHIEEAGLSYRTDSTNSDTVFLRNFLRHEVLPAFNKREDIDIFSSIEKATQNLQSDSDALNQIALESQTDRVDKLLKLHDAVLFRVLYNQLDSKFGISLDKVHFELIKELLKKSKSKEILSDGVYAKTKDGRLVFEKEGTIVRSSKKVAIGENEFYGKHILIKKHKEIYNALTINHIDCDKITSDLYADNKKDGDVFYCQKRNASKKLKKLLTNDKIRDKDSLIIIRNENGDIVFVEGYGADKRYAADKTSKNIICIEII